MKKPNATLESFSREVVQIMPLFVREFARRENNHLTQGKISCPQMVTLDFLSQHRRSTVSEIAKTLAIQPSSASVLVDRLIRAKMLRRDRDSKDRRVVWVTATPTGRKVVSEIKRQKRRSLQAIFKPLGARERAQYLSVMRKVKDHLLKGTSDRA